MGSCAAPRPGVNGGKGFFHGFIINDEIFLCNLSLCHLLPFSELPLALAIPTKGSQPLVGSQRGLSSLRPQGSTSPAGFSSPLTSPVRPVQMSPEPIRVAALQREPVPRWKTQVEPHRAFPRLRLLGGAAADVLLCPLAVFTPRVIGTAVARYNFAARDMRELSLREGDVVKIYSRIGGDQGWWKGETNGRVSAAGVPSLFSPCGPGDVQMCSFPKPVFGELMREWFCEWKVQQPGERLQVCTGVPHRSQHWGHIPDVFIAAIYSC